MNRTLQVIGIVALFAWTALGVFAWSRVSGDLQLVLEPAGGGEGSEELALLTDQVALLSSDVDALAGALESGMGEVARVLEEREASQETRAAVAEERLRALEASLPAALEAREGAAALSAALRHLEALATSLETGRAADVGVATDPSVARSPAPSRFGDALPSPTYPGEPSSFAGGAPRSSAADAAGGGEPLSEAPGPSPGSASPAPSAPGAEPAAGSDEPARSFLAFRLPSRDFAFEGRSGYEVLPALSRVGFDAKSTLHDFTGAADRVSGHFVVDLARPEAGIEGRVEIDAHDLVTGLEARDEALLEHLDAAEFERIVFEATSFEPTEVDVEGRRLAGTIHGRMTIRGRTRELAMAVAAHVDESRRLVIEGETPLSLTDFGVPVPSKLGVISMEDEVRIWIHLRARSASA